MKSEFFTRNETAIRDVLDTVTVLYDTLHQGSHGSLAEQWLEFVCEVFNDEHLNYRIDINGVVHPFVDAEFEVNRTAALDVLNDPKFGEARRDFDAAFQHLRDENGKEAIKAMFPAVETAAKVLFPGAMSRLMPNEIDSHLMPRLLSQYAG